MNDKIEDSNETEERKQAAVKLHNALKLLQTCAIYSFRDNELINLTLKKLEEDYEFSN